MAEHTTTCGTCGYNAPHHGPGCAEAAPRTFFCAAHAPAQSHGYDDVQVVCSTCGVRTMGGRYTR